MMMSSQTVWTIVYMENGQQHKENIELSYDKVLQVERWFNKRNKKTNKEFVEAFTKKD